jgi:hypothetical protein
MKRVALEPRNLDVIEIHGTAPRPIGGYLQREVIGQVTALEGPREWEPRPGRDGPAACLRHNNVLGICGAIRARPGIRCEHCVLRESIAIKVDIPRNGVPTDGDWATRTEDDTHPAYVGASRTDGKWHHQRVTTSSRIAGGTSRADDSVGGSIDASSTRRRYHARPAFC